MEMVPDIRTVFKLSFAVPVYRHWLSFWTTHSSLYSNLSTIFFDRRQIRVITVLKNKLDIGKYISSNWVQKGAPWKAANHSLDDKQITNMTTNMLLVLLISLMLPHFSISYFHPCEDIECYLLSEEFFTAKRVDNLNQVRWLFQVLIDTVSIAFIGNVKEAALWWLDVIKYNRFRIHSITTQRRFIFSHK